MNYQDLFQYGQLDLEAAQCMIANEYYSHAALLGQQALEKHVKAYLLKNMVFKNTAGLRHLPISGIIEKMKESLIPYVNQSSSISSPELVSVFESIETYLSKLENNNELQIIVWKQSMSIPLTDHELKIDGGSMVKFFETANSFQNAIPNFRKEFGGKTNIQKLKKLDLTKVSLKEKAMVEYVLGLDESLEEGKGNSKQTMKLLENLIDNVGYGTGKNSMSKEETKKIQDFLILYKCLNWTDMMIQAYTHQTISRYPAVIDGKMAVDLYVDYKDQLCDWIGRITTICTDIRTLK